MRWTKYCIVFIVALQFAIVGQDTGHYYLMSYFKNSYAPLNDMAGSFFALSTDGMNWTELNGGAPVITQSWIGEKLMRDPYIYFDAAAMKFRLIYTTGWTMKCLGYLEISIADGKDFKKFQDWTVLDNDGHRQIPVYVSDSIPSSICTWAPEIIWDDIQNKFMVYWSTDCGSGKRSYYVLTSDFKTYTNPVKFFDPGFTEIDGDLLKVANGNYYFFFKDERDAGRQIFYVTGSSPQGPWSEISASSINTLQGVEGPSSIKMGNEYRVFFDPYSTRVNYRMVKSLDLKTWTDAGTIKANGANFYYSHCNVIEIPKNIYDWIQTSKLAVHWNGKPYMPKYAAGTCLQVPGVYNVMGKKMTSIYPWTNDKAQDLSPGFFINVNKNKKSGNFLNVSR
jgi:hypothetical protein